jgi:precorrin-6A/cobalt-precorrin-6A reductase
LLTIGSTHLRPYAEQARAAGRTLVARVLDHPGSLQACRDAGIAPSRVIASRGPHTVADNCAHLRAHGADVLVTKDGGAAGGVEQKLRAAAETHCQVVALRRPPPPPRARNSIEEVLRLIANRRQALAPQPIEPAHSHLDQMPVRLWQDKRARRAPAQ